nr:DUF2089 domain-containing protein [Spirochaeta isovalerica]
MNIPGKCPSCGGKMTAVKMECHDCGTVMDGRFSPCPVCSLDPEMRELFDLFMHSRGNLKEVQRILQLSYPTVRSRIEGMFAAYEKSDSSKIGRMEILKMLRTGDIDVVEAEKLLRDADK